MPIVTLLSDFGVKDAYVAQMKGEVLNNCPDCVIVDISHEVQKHDILQGAFLLQSTVQYFPTGTVHVAVVDPEVGGRRLPLAVNCRGGILVGPDNGLLFPASRKLGFVAAHKIQPSGRWPREISSTFHGRDLFAVAGGMLASGVAVQRLGPRVSGLVSMETPVPELRSGLLKCHVMHVDRFGNLITDAEGQILDRMKMRPGKQLALLCKGGPHKARVVRNYQEGSRGELVVLKDSQGYLEVARREDDAALLLGVGVHDELVLGSVSLAGRSQKGRGAFPKLLFEQGIQPPS